MQGGAVDPSMHELMEGVHQQLQTVAESLNGISASLISRGGRDSLAEQEQLASRIAGEMRQALSPLFNPIRVAIEDLNRTIHMPGQDKPLSTDDMEQLVDLLSERIPRDRAGAAASGVGRTRWRLPGLGSSRKDDKKGI